MSFSGSIAHITEGDLLSRYKRGSSLSSRDKAHLMMDYRDIQIGQGEDFFPKNSISTTKYTLATFLFINLYEQFSKLANVYFLFLAFLQTIKVVSITGGIPTILPPLAFIVLLTMVKDVYEDYKRYKSDQEENNKETLVYQNGQFRTIMWKDIRVGELVKVNKNEFFPCDLLMIASSDYRKGQCFIETKNLDGETNLKARNISEDLRAITVSENAALALEDNIINAEGPNQYLATFKGSFIYNETKYPLSGQNLLLRGCILRNTDYIIGCAVYTGYPLYNKPPDQSHDELSQS
jgi:phospholipid-transporting ATPase